MSYFAHLEGQNFAFNMERVDYFIRSDEHATDETPARYLITFYSNEIKVGIWVYETPEVRDNQFAELIDRTYEATGRLSF